MISPIISIFDLARDIIRAIVTDKKQAGELTGKLDEMAGQGALKTIEGRFKALLVEQRSKDKFTSRARPGFLYTIYFLILLAPIISAISIFYPAEIIKFLDTMREYFGSIPEQLWLLFGAVLVGYTGLRTLEKLMGLAK